MGSSIFYRTTFKMFLTTLKDVEIQQKKKQEKKNDFKDSRAFKRDRLARRKNAVVRQLDVVVPQKSRQLLRKLFEYKCAAARFCERNWAHRSVEQGQLEVVPCPRGMQTCIQHVFHDVVRSAWSPLPSVSRRLPPSCGPQPLTHGPTCSPCIHLHCPFHEFMVFPNKKVLAIETTRNALRFTSHTHR